jgi:tetratricopeptide (TPR) repeat protein
MAASEHTQSRKPQGLRKWLYRLTAMTLVPMLLFGVLELSLRAGGYGEATDFFVDGVAIEHADVWIDNGVFGRWVFPRRLEQVPQPLAMAFPKRKADGTYRVFVLGESAALGFPDPSTSFARVLEVMLRARYPETRFEVVNTAMTAINSHVALPIARHCARRQPDLFIVHLGNNEVVGPFGAAGVLGPFSPHLQLIRTNLAVKTTRTGQLINRGVECMAHGQERPQTWDGMAMFTGSQMRADDARLTRIYAHFRSNLEDICGIGQACGVPVILCTIPVNLKDSAPFASLHAPDLDAEAVAKWDGLYKSGVSLEAEGKLAEAIRVYARAEAIDSTYAELAFRRGRSALALGHKREAQQHFVRARDLDTLRFRSDTTINATIRDVAAQPGVALADAERAFDDRSGSGVPDDDLFLEHVHMNFKGNYLLARTVLETIVELGPARLGRAAADAVEPLSEQNCAARLAQTEWSEWRFGTRIYDQLMQGPPFTMQCDHAKRTGRWQDKLAALKSHLQSGGFTKAVDEYRTALREAEDDVMIRVNFGELLTEIGSLPEAREQYAQALGRLRHDSAVQTKAGTVDLKLNNPAAAERHFREALRMAPDDAEASIGLAEAQEGQGHTAEALAILQGQVRRAPTRAFALGALGRFLYRTGKLEEAREQFTEALRREPKRAAIHVDLGMTVLKQGDVDKALEHFEDALRLQPDWPELRKHVAELQQQRKQGKADGR